MADIPKIPENEITPQELYVNRRHFLRATTVAGSGIATGAIYRWFNPTNVVATNSNEEIVLETVEETEESLREKGWVVDEDKTSEESILNYNNFYEFTTAKNLVARVAADFKTTGWQIIVDGLVNKPLTLSLADLEAISPSQERVYRMRCVEAWSMVIPWAGIPLAHILEAVEPTASAKYVAFETLLDPTRMPGQKVPVLDWPYLEGLRLDEAMNPLTLLATGIYGKSLAPQNGAPVRLVIPWKYGFKGIKSIVRITLTDEEPICSWNRYAPREYGFYANVNPNVDHPRWSQATEQRIGELGRRRTHMFNGYEQQVGEMYEGLDLWENF